MAVADEEKEKTFRKGCSLGVVETFVGVQCDVMWETIRSQYDKLQVLVNLSPR